MNNHIPQAEEERKNSNVFVQDCGIESLNMRISEIFYLKCCTEGECSISYSDVSRIQQMKKHVAAEKFPLLPK